MIYLASPYSHDNPLIVKWRVDQTMQCFAALCRKRSIVFSPILQCHHTAIEFSLPTDAAHWERYNTGFLRKSDAVYVLTIDGWEESKGVVQEIALAVQLKVPVYYVDVNGNVRAYTIT